MKDWRKKIKLEGEKDSWYTRSKGEKKHSGKKEGWRKKHLGRKELET